jgi:ADP-heptose:LPS heptosyltransferase
MIGFCPGAEFGPAKRWPHYHYAELAKQLIDEGYQIVLFGSAKTTRRATKFSRRSVPNSRPGAAIWREKPSWSRRLS